MIAGQTPAALTLPGIVRSAALTPNGRKLFVLTEKTLFEIDLETLSRRGIFTSEVPLLRFSLSAAGDRFLLQTTDQALLIDTARTLYTFNGPVTDGILSADGRTAFVIATPNRLIRIKDGEAQEHITSPPEHCRRLPRLTRPSLRWPLRRQSNAHRSGPPLSRCRNR